MPWDENGGNKGRNPWGGSSDGGSGGKGPKSPWGSGGGNNGSGRGPTPPDVDDLLARISKTA